MTELEDMQCTQEVIRLIDWLRNANFSDKKIVECIHYITAEE